MRLIKSRYFHKIRIHYWSCGKVNKFLRNFFGLDKKPSAATIEEWDELDKQDKMKPIRAWIADDFLDILQDIVYFPYDVYHSIDCYISNRFIRKPYMLDSKLDRGQYHDLVEVMLHANMEALVDFIELDCAYRYQSFNNKKCRRSREDGLVWFDEHLELNHCEENEEIKAIYLWWKDDYEREYDEAYDWFPDKPARELSKEELDICIQKEKEFSDKEQEMLIRLMKVRQYLWV